MAIVGEAMTDFDTAGSAALAETVEYCERYGVEVILARLHSRASEDLTQTGGMDKIGEARIHSTVRAAADAATGESGLGS